MKNFKFLALLILSVSLLTISCQSEDDNLSEQSVPSEFTTFKTAFPELITKISYENVQKTNFNKNGAAKSKNRADGVTFPIMDNNKVVGRYIGLSDESTSLYIDFSNYENKIVIYNVNDPSEFETLNTVYNSDTDKYEVDLSAYRSRFWCGVRCTVAALAIAAADGPSPLMDILAVAYQVSCLAECDGY